LVENRDFFHTPLHSMPPLGGPRRNIAILFGAPLYLCMATSEMWCWSYYTIPVWCGKTRMVGLSNGEKTL